MLRSEKVFTVFRVEGDQHHDLHPVGGVASGSGSDNSREVVPLTSGLGAVDPIVEGCSGGSEG